MIENMRTSRKVDSNIFDVDPALIENSKGKEGVVSRQGGKFVPPAGLASRPRVASDGQSVATED